MPSSLEKPLHLPIGSTIGVLGGGQLGRMMAMAAARLGYHVHVFSHAPGGPTEQVCRRATIADYDDEAALASFADAVDVVTLEWENIPHAALEFLARRVPARPGPGLLATAQDRAVEKRAVREAGAATTPWREVTSLDELRRAAADLDTPSVLKTARFGYDGKGQVTIRSLDDVDHAWDAVGRVRCILEAHVDFEAELSTVVARNASGQVAVYDVVENHHVNHILDTTHAPAGADPDACSRAAATAIELAEAFQLEGMLAVEYFLTRSGELWVNEVAPRPHNSGHWTLDACTTSQFEQLVRAVCNLPLGSPRRHSDAVMHNLIGPLGERWLEHLNNPDACVHLYGKHDARPGRKMGHVTTLAEASAHHVAHLG